MVVLDFFNQTGHNLVGTALFAVSSINIQKLELRGEYTVGDDLRIETVVVGDLVDSDEFGYFVGDMLIDAIDIDLPFLYILEIGYHFVVLVGEDRIAALRQ